MPLRFCGLTSDPRGAQVETNTMSAKDHDGKKDDKGGAANYSAINLNKDFLQKLKEAGKSIGHMRPCRNA